LKLKNLQLIKFKMTKAKQILLKWAVISSSKPPTSGFWRVVGWPIRYPTPTKVSWSTIHEKFTEM
jgi:hypothetical protein